MRVASVDKSRASTPFIGMNAETGETLNIG